MAKELWGGMGYEAFYRKNRLTKEGGGDGELPRLSKYIEVNKNVIQGLQNAYRADTNSYDREEARKVLLANQRAGYDISPILNRNNYLFIAEDIAQYITKTAEQVGFQIPEIKQELETMPVIKRKETPLKVVQVRTKAGKLYYRSKNAPVSDTEIFIIKQYIRNKRIVKDKTIKSFYEDYMRLDGKYKVKARTYRSFETLWRRISQGKRKVKG